MPDLVPTDLPALEARSAEARAKLNSRQAKFVDALMVEGTQVAAARVAGYGAPDKYGAIVARLPNVRAAFEAAKAVAAAKAGYTVEKMMAELDVAIGHAQRTENASAHVQAIVAKGKLTGIYAERVDARVAVGGFVLHVHGLGGDRG
mgnify:FL=1